MKPMRVHMVMEYGQIARPGKARGSTFISIVVKGRGDPIEEPIARRRHDQCERER